MADMQPEALAVRVVASVAGDTPLGTLEPVADGWLARPADGSAPLVLDDRWEARAWLVRHSQHRRLAAQKDSHPTGMGVSGTARREEVLT